MKKIILVAAIGMFALASCKRDYVCQCTEKFSAPNVADGYSNYIYNGALVGRP